MESVLISVVVTAIFFVITATVGGRLGHTAKPYGIVKLAAHIILFLLVSGGVIASIYKLQGVMDNKLYSTISLYVAALTLLTNFTIGISMVLIKQKNRKLVLVHKLSTRLMATSIVASILFLTVKI
ncbi:hypothetical protein [Methyloglobulus sp.]|uniref:hypothetical protein n=1 Tax=Methyloglobulus sp. TaxID=2518622 RepID=UPI0039897845